MVLACGSWTKSRLQRHAWLHHPPEAVLQGSPVLLPNTGTVHAECCPAALRPKVYCVPSMVVTRQYSPSLSPLLAPVRCSILEPSSSRGRQTSLVAVEESSRTSS